LTSDVPPQTLYASMNRTLLLLSGTLLIGGLVVFWLYQQEYKKHEAGGAPVEVLAAAVDIQLGTTIRPEWLTTEEIPQSYIEDRHLPAAAMRDLIGTALSQSVRAGEAILRTDLNAQSDGHRTLSGAVPSGQRAATISVREGGAFGGLIRPGDRVDVLLAVGQRDSPETWRQVVVLENLLLLAVGRELTIRDTEAETQRVRFARASNITLQVTIPEGQILTAARRRGELSLLLRNPNDLEVRPEIPDLTAPDLFDRQRRARFLRRAPPVATAPAPVPATPTP
jgi:pilus assembly protein CpaB